MYIDPFLNGNPKCPENELEPERVDMIGITHGHGDHVGDASSSRRSTPATSSRRSSSPAGSSSQGVEKTHDPNKGGTVDVEGVKFTLTNAFHSLEQRRRHLHGRAVRHRRSTLEDGTKVYFAGDTCVFGDMQLIGRLYSPDVAVLPIGGHYTMDPKEAAVALELLGTKRCVPCHFGTFPVLAGRRRSSRSSRRTSRWRRSNRAIRSSCDASMPVVATYSIVACDLDRAQWGVATQSKFLAVGSVVPWAEARVGAVATQSYANPQYGPDGLALLRQGLPAQEVVKRLTEADEGREQRQLGVVDASGRAATYTGGECHDWAGGRTGDGYAAQGNILVSAETVDALAETFEGSSRATAGRAAPRLPRRGAGGRRRQARPAVRGVARRREGRGLRRSLGRRRRAARGRPRAAARGAAPDLPAARRALRPDAEGGVARRRRRRCARS